MCACMHSCMRVCVCACMFVCVCVPVCVCVRACMRGCARAGESVSARVLCFSVCQFHFVWLSKPICSNLLFYATDLCVSIYAFHAFV